LDDGRQSSDDVAGRADFIRWAMGILLALAALWLDPFDFSTHTAQLSDQILNRLLGDRLLGRMSGDESAITVVLTLDTDARLAGPGQAPAQPSPILPIAVHAEILDRVLAYRPAAVFLDYRFLLDRSAEEKGLERLGEVLTAYAGEENGRRTLLFVVVAPDVLPPLGMSDALAQRFTRLTRSAPNSRRPADDLAPPYPFVVADQHLRPDAQHLYRLAHDLPVLTGVADYRLSPAFAIYRALCRETPSSPDAPDALKALAERSPELCELDGTDPASALRIIWGSSIATPQKDWQRCNEPGWAEVLWRSAFGDAWGAG
jgi:hypothetical protein